MTLDQILQGTIDLLPPAVTERLSRTIERMEVERALQLNETRYRLLVDTTAGFAFEMDREGTVTSVTPGIEDLLGYSVDEIVGKNPIDLTTQETADRLRSAVQTSFATGQPIRQIDLTTLAKDGSVHYTRGNAIVIQDEHGTPKGLFGTLQDITTQKRIEDELRRSRELLEETGRMARVGGWEIDLEKNTVY